MAVLKNGLAVARSGIMPTASAGGYPSNGGGLSLPVANLSASDRWRALGGSEGAPKQLENGCRWVGGAEKVEIESNLIRQCTEGTEAGKVTDLNFHFKFVQQISGLAELAPTLRSLNLSTNNIRVLEGLSGMAKLRELKLYSCQISRIQGLEQMPSLMALHLEDNHIGAIEGLDHLRALEYLNMDSNRLQKIGKGLARLTKLKELHLARNQLSSLDGLQGLVSLETCSFDDNRLTTVTSENVKGLVKLDELHIAGNQLQSLSFLSAGVGKPHPSLPSLVQLDASKNQLQTASLRSLPALPQLAELNLAGNLIEDVELCLVSSFPSLEILDLSGNQLKRGAEDLAQLKEMSSLRELLIQGNPFTKNGPEEAQQALSILSCLELLDDQVIERKTEADVLMLDGSNQDTETFPLTLPKGLDAEGKSRPDTASSRPGTAGSQRPGTAQKMSAAGVRDPLMLTKPKLSDKRFASEDQINQWSRQTQSALLAVQRQIDKTCVHVDRDMKDMSKFLRNADKVLERERELSGKRASSPDPDEFDMAEASLAESLPTLRSATLSEDEEPAARRDSRLASRLHAAVGQGCPLEGLDEDDDDDEAFLAAMGSLPPSPLASPSRAALAAAAAAACDEEIEEEDPVVEACPVPSSPEPAEEVDEDLSAGVDADAVATLGPRAARALAAAAATVAAEAQPGLRVDARAKDRVSLQRPSSRGSQGHARAGQGKIGSQPGQGQRARPPVAAVAPVRTSSRGPKR